MAEFIEVREVGLRDGLQNIKTAVPTDIKFAWIKAEVAAGVKDIEVCSFVPPKLLPQFADAEEITRRALTVPGLTVAALMPNLKGAERGAALGVHRLDYVVSVSEGHNLSNVRRSTAESLADLRRIADFLRGIEASKRPRLLCGLATSFGCTIEGNVPHDRVVSFAEAVAAAGVDEIALADTVGFGNPNAVRTLFTRVRKAIGPNLVLAAHFHDTRGLGVANVSAAIEAGVRHFDASLCGLGGCPYAPGATGNVVTEDVVFLAESLGFNTGIDLDRLIAVRKIVSDALPGEAVYGQVAKAGLPKGFSYAGKRKAA
jgi:hydroxymethylglutaryl-CoA lyase